MPSYQRQIIEQAKFAYSLLDKTFEKQIKTIADQGEKQVNGLEYHGEQFVESNEFTDNDFNIRKDWVPLEKQKKYLMNLLKKNLTEFKRKN